MNKRLELVKEEKAITLVVLVITIVILLILAGISISALTNTGLFGKAKEAKEKTQNAEKEQNKILGEYEHTLDQYDEKTLVYKVNNGTIKIGDYVSYTPDTASTENILKELKTYSGSDANTTDTLRQEELKWRVLDTKDGNVRLISEKPTSSTITLNGNNGYNNAVKLLDDICSTLYNSKLDNKVTNLKIEDITYHMNTKPAENSTTYTLENIKYPKMLEKEKNQIVKNSILNNKLDLSNQEDFITGNDISDSSTLTKTYWSKSMKEIDFINPVYYNLFINNGSNYNTYWLSSRCVNAYGGADFNCFDVISGGVSAYRLTDSWGLQAAENYALRPIISLNSNVSVTSGNGKIDSPYELK